MRRIGGSACANGGALLHQARCRSAMRISSSSNTLNLEAPAPPGTYDLAPAKLADTDTPANEEAETAADAAEGEPES